jgi:hypothetical protein
MVGLVLAILAMWAPWGFASAVTGVTITNRIQLTQAGASNTKLLVGSCTMSTSYTSGGDTLTAAQLGLQHIYNVVITNPQLDGYTLGCASLSSTSVKIQAYGPGSNMTIAWPAGVPTNAAMTAKGQQDVFPYVKASIVAADDVTGTIAFSTAAAVLGANYNWISVTAVPSNGVAETLAHQPDVPRNLTIVCHNINGGAVANAATSWAVVGVYNGAAQTETISIPAVSQVNGNMIYKSGAKPFDSITSITPTITGGTETAGFQTAIGIGGLIGLSKPLYTPAEADVELVTQTAVPVAISSITSATNNTIKFATITANDYLVVKYKTGGFAAAPVISWPGGVPTSSGSYAQASGNLSGIGSVYFVAFGY